MCSFDEIGFYPSGFYTARKGLCAFNKEYPVKNLNAFYQAIQFVIGKSFSFETIVQSVGYIDPFRQTNKTSTASTNINHQCA